LKAIHDYDENMSQRLLNYGAKIKNLKILNKSGKKVMDLHYKDLHPKFHGIGLQRVKFHTIFHNQSKLYLMNYIKK
jgi:hypothetical protein